MKCYIYVLRLKDKNIYSHSLIQNYLTKKHPDLKDCYIVKNKNNKPFLSVKKNIYSLSISHKDEYICIAFSKGNFNLGIDIEKIDIKTLSLSKKFCVNEEVLDIENNEDKEALATLYWSVKEAVGKSYGEGLLIHPKKTLFRRECITIERSGKPVPAFIKTYKIEGYVVSFVAIPKK